jgi:hypothetical protein
MMGALLRRLSGRRPAAERSRFEHDAAYEDHHALSRRGLARPAHARAGPLRERGFEMLRVLDAGAAGDLRRRIESRFECAVARKKSPHLLLYHIDDADFDREFLERALTPAVDERALGFFESEYFVLWYTVSRAVPVREAGKNSFLWHCDRGPRAHLKLLLYLNDHSEHGGGTEFLDLAASRRIAETGYVYAPVRTRVGDLAPLAARVGVEFAPWQARPDAGEGILFQPAGVLHRGLLPTRGPRLVATICLLPSPIPWRAALDRGVRPRAASDEKWPDAGELRAALSPADA